MIFDFFKKLEKKKENENRKIAQLIGDYYLDKNNYNYIDTEEEIRSLGITQIENKGNTIIITLQRPGLLIGRRGSNIGMLQKFLFNETKYTKLNIKEDKILPWLIPLDYSKDCINNDYDCC